MKNGAARTREWIKRQLKNFQRDNDGLQACLSLVDIHPIPSLDELATWSDEQALLAHDWALTVHLKASDNNVRVPAIPEHLKRYRRTYTNTASMVARKLVQEMGADSGTCFHPTEAQMARLVAGVQQMMQHGCPFTEAQIQLFAAGEHSEMLTHFTNAWAGFEEANEALGQIFDELDDSGQQKSDEQREADKKRHHQPEEP